MVQICGFHLTRKIQKNIQHKGASPLTSHRGSAPWGLDPRWDHRPQTAVIGLRSALVMTSEPCAVLKLIL